MAEQVLSQNEIDALLSAVNDGSVGGDAGGPSSMVSDQAAVKYDLLSQDRIIRGRMPTLDIINDRFARMFRITLSNSLRKILQVSVESTSLMKYGEFLNYLPIPSCLNIVRFHPLRGSCVIAIEAKLIFAFLNNFFGGATNAQERVEGRDFTAVELMIIQRVVRLMLDDIEGAWQSVFPIKTEHLRTEINPQFLAVVPPSDVIVLTSFELEMENLRGTVQVVIPYSTVEPIRARLSSGIQTEADAEETGWGDQITEHLYDIEVPGEAVLGRQRITLRDLLDLQVGEIITLDRLQDEPLELNWQGKLKFKASPKVKAGNYGAEIIEDVPPREPESGK